VYCRRSNMPFVAIKRNQKSGAGHNRRATQPPAHFHRNPPGRLEKQPTDLRRMARYFGDSTLPVVSVRETEFRSQNYRTQDPQTPIRRYAPNSEPQTPNPKLQRRKSQPVAAEIFKLARSPLLREIPSLFRACASTPDSAFDLRRLNRLWHLLQPHPCWRLYR
jgi:hypothetical protein